MKTTLLALVLALTGSTLWAQTPPGLPSHRPLPHLVKPAPAAATKSAAPEEMIPAGAIDFESADVNQVLNVYAKMVNRTLLMPADLKGGQIVLKTQTALTKTQVIEALQAVLALNGIAVVSIGEKFVKVVPVDQANSAGAAFNDQNATNLPDLGSYVTRIVQLNYVKPSEMVPILQPFAKLANSILPIDSNGILVLRDYAENVKRMMEMIARVDVNVPDEYISDVIPIKYAKAEDLANALNSLGDGGSTISFGASSSASRISGIHGGTSGFNGMNNNNNNAGGMAQTMSLNGTPTGGTTFQDRLRSIVQRASGGGSGGSSKDKIEIFGQTKIVADERSNSLLVFATKADMVRIKQIISKLDVMLPQVLIESIIMDVGLGTAQNLGVSVQQNPQQLGGSVIGGGAINNGQGFANYIKSAIATNGSGNVISGITSSLGTNALASGLSYFGSIGNSWNVAVQAALSDNNSTIIQRPRIQTSQGVPAQFFVGQTVPYVDNTYNNYTTGGYGGSSYSQLSVGVELDVTPLINPDGIVDMQIQQEIDDISGYTAIDGNQVPNTDKRTLNTEIAVRDHETVVLGGFIRDDKSNTKSGVPWLMDIPLLGRLFSASSNSKDRTELMVLIRPTVLQTPEIAAEQTIRVAQHMPVVSAAAADDAAYERQLIEAERQKELKNARSGQPADGFYNMNPNNISTNNVDTNMDSADFGTAPNNAVEINATTPVQVTTPMTSQDKAKAALEQKMNELDQAEPSAQPQ